MTDMTDMNVMPDNWDDEGAKSISKKTFETANKFMTIQCERFMTSQIGKMEFKEAAAIVIPSINPVTDGSIDLYWETDNCRLLINIPASPDSTASFYGDNHKGVEIEGTLDINDFDDCLLLQLVEQNFMEEDSIEHPCEGAPLDKIDIARCMNCSDLIIKDGKWVKDGRFCDCCSNPVCHDCRGEKD